jgi:hypothetical protein
VPFALHEMLPFFAVKKRIPKLTFDGKAFDFFRTARASGFDEHESSGGVGKEGSEKTAYVKLQNGFVEIVVRKKDDMQLSVFSLYAHIRSGERMCKHIGYFSADNIEQSLFDGIAFQRNRNERAVYRDFRRKQKEQRAFIVRKTRRA